MAGSRIVLQRRDRRLLAALELLAVIDRTHAERLGPFASLQRANARLLQLTKAGVLRRDFFGTIAGGRKSIYRLPRRRLRRGQSIAHELAVADVYAGFAATTPPAGIRFSEWRRIDQPLGGVVPDGIAQLEVSGRELPLLIEVDRGTEAQSVIARKADSYLALALSGTARFRVAIVTTSTRRLQNLQTTISKRTDKLFWLTTLDALRERSPWAPIWYRPRGDRAEMLFPHICDTAAPAPGSPPANHNFASPAAGPLTESSAPAGTKTPGRLPFAAPADQLT